MLVRTRSTAMPSTCSRRCTRRGERFDVVVLDPPAFIKRRKDHPQRPGGLSQAQPAGAAAAGAEGACWSAAPAPITSARASCWADPDARRGHLSRFVQVLAVGGQSPRPPGASGHPRNPLSEGILLPRHVESTAPMLTVSATSTPLPCRLGPLRIHWYGIMYLLAFGAAWWLARRRAAPPGLDLERAGRRRSHLLRDARRHPRRARRLCAVLRPADCGATDALVSAQDLAGRHVVPRRLPRRAGRASRCSRGDARPPHRRRVRFRSRRCRASACWRGRIGNFINGELWGKPTTCPGASSSRTRQVSPCASSQLYEALLEGLRAVRHRCGGSRRDRGRASRPRGCSCCVYALSRILVEFVRVPDANSATWPAAGSRWACCCRCRCCWSASCCSPGRASRAAGALRQLQAARLMEQYLDLLRHVREHGARKTDRTGTGTLSVFGTSCASDLGARLPAGHHQEHPPQVGGARTAVVPARRHQHALPARARRDDLGRVGRRARRARPGLRPAVARLAHGRRPRGSTRCPRCCAQLRATTRIRAASWSAPGTWANSTRWRCSPAMRCSSSTWPTAGSAASCTSAAPTSSSACRSTSPPMRC